MVIPTKCLISVHIHKEFVYSMEQDNTKLVVDGVMYLYLWLVLSRKSSCKCNNSVFSIAYNIK
jgi:hypothetical protein